MANLPRPPDFTGAYQSPDSEMLEAIGLVAVAAAGVEAAMHFLYWKLSKLDRRRGQIITRDMRVSKLKDDITKFARTTIENKKKARDLCDLMDQIKKPLELRNRYIHWIWEVKLDYTHIVSAPIYRRGEDFLCTLADIQGLSADLEWIEVRVEAHCMTDHQLLRRRRELGETADLYAPAPWL